MAQEQEKEMVVGRNEAQEWVIMPVEDNASDSLKTGILVNASGIKYPEDHELVAELIASQ